MLSYIGTGLSYCRLLLISSVRNSSVLDCAVVIRSNRDWREIIGSQRVSVQVKDHRDAAAHSKFFFIPQSDIPAQLNGAACIDRRLQFLKGVNDILCDGHGDGAEGLGCVGAGAVVESSGVVVSLSAGELLGVVGVVGAGSADGSAVTLLSGVWVLLCCEPVAGITRSFVIEFVSSSLTAQLPHLGVRVIVVPAAAFTVKVNASGTKICPV